MNAEAIFAEALAKNTPAERAAYLDEVCGLDMALRNRVETLLRSHDAAGSFLGKAAIQVAAEKLAGQARCDATEAEPGAEDTDDEPLGFLGPSDKPESLGRLGHYEILEVIGRGGMGIVLRAFDEKLHRIVAIKVMAPELAATSPPRKRFLREARSAAQVRHEHVVDIHAVEEHPIPYLVMEYIPGETLQQKHERVGPFEVPEVLRLGQQIARGLAAAHERGLIHRDIKPSNILLEKGAEERVKITDFGLARAVADASLTQSGVIAGTPMYMAPEQTAGDSIDHRADLFSLGSVLYTMCSGRPPFRATSTMATLKRVAEDAPRPIREIIPEIPEWLCDIVAKLQAKKPEDRFHSAMEVADLLGKCLAELQQGQPISVGQAAALPEKPKAARESEAKPTITGQAGSWLRHHCRWAAAAAVLLVLGGFSLTEATGITNLRATVIRIFTPEGTLVVETDDPAVKVTIEGGGDLVISGAGPQEVRLKSGSYKLRATRNGKAVKLDRDLVTITHGDRQVVRVRLEAGDRVGEVRRFEGHEGPVRSVAFSPDGRYALSGSGFPDGDKTMRLWDVTSGTEVRRFEGHEGSINFVALSPNGERALSSGFDKTMRLWDVKTGQPLRVFRGHDETVTKIVFTPDGRRALSGSQDKTVRLWDLETGEELRRFKGHTNLVLAVSLAPDGRHFLSASWDGTVRLWNLDTGEELHRYSDSDNALYDVEFLPDGRRFLTGGDDGVLRLWDLDAGKVLLRFEGHTLQVFGLAVSRDGSRALSASGDGTVRLWDVSTGRQLQCFRHHEIVATVAFSPDGRYALSGGGFVFRNGNWLNGTDWAIHLWRLPDPPDP
jgi:hypothetical protein